MGYMIVDDRGSGGDVLEFDTVACRHCHRAIRVVRKQATGLYCMRCAGPVCEPCGASGVCTPLLKRIDEQLSRQAFADAAGLKGR